jgi:ATPase subunit of ABC transporter with duplicated ATPase domains
MNQKRQQASVTMRYGSKVLFEDVSVTFTPGRRYGPHRPQRRRQIHLHEDPHRRARAAEGHRRPPQASSASCARISSPFDAYRVIDTVIMGNAPLWKALEERDRIYEKAELTDEDGMRLGELEGVVGDEDGYTAESDAAILLQGLDIPDELHERKMSELQGGQKVRVLLAQALFGKPQALMLDEPTNHLDLESIHWLRRTSCWLRRHAHHHLARPPLPQRVTTHTADIDYQTIITYTGGYDDMVVAKTQIRSRLESQNAQREKKIAQLNEFIARFAAGTRSTQVTSRKKEVERLQTNELARSNIQRPFIKFDQIRPSGKHVLELKASASLWRPERDRRLQRLRPARRKSLPHGPQRRRQNHHAQEPSSPPMPDVAERTSRSTPASSSGATKHRSATSRRTSPASSSTA